MTQSRYFCVRNPFFSLLSTIPTVVHFEILHSIAAPDYKRYSSFNIQFLFSVCLILFFP
jgi:hypothetical protein